MAILMAYIVFLENILDHHLGKDCYLIIYSSKVLGSRLWILNNRPLFLYDPESHEKHVPYICTNMVAIYNVICLFPQLLKNNFCGYGNYILMSPLARQLHIT